MGSGGWSRVAYSSANTTRRSAGISDFDYSDRVVASTPRSERKVHEDLDPKGVEFRESRDSDEHPTSLAISVLFDVTGSMSRVPRRLMEKLPELFGLILRKGYVEHPQVMFGAIGDATCDQMPLQVGQFESDNRLDENLMKVHLEGGGGGGNHESYELAMYFMARHTSIDCFEKRGHRGYLFIIGDEQAYPTVKVGEVDSIIGDGLQEKIDLKVILSELQAKYDVYYIQPGETSYWGHLPNEEYWRDLLGQQYIRVEDPDAVAETIALTIGLAEGAVDDLDEGLDHLAEVGSTAGAAVGRALATVGASRGSIAVSESPADLDASDGAERA
jgi:hypothetical protein